MNGKNIQPIHYNLQPNSGFTILEVLIALFIISIAFSASVYLIVTNSNSANIIKNTYIASGLIQEGVEVVRNLRDGDWFAGRPFGAFGNPGGLEFADGAYRVQWNSAFPLSGLSVYLNKDNASGLYSYDPGGVPTLFQRQIQLTTVNPNVEKKIVVTVSWFERNASRSLSAEEHLYNWK